MEVIPTSEVHGDIDKQLVSFLDGFEIDMQAEDPAEQRNLVDRIEICLARGSWESRSDEETPDLELYELYHQARQTLGEKGERFCQAFRAALIKLVSRFPTADHTIEYFAHLLALIGLLKVEDASSTLSRLAKMESGKLKGKLADGEDLHLRLLKALVANGIQDEETSAVCGRDVSDPRYSEVCFDALYQKGFLTLQAR